MSTRVPACLSAAWVNATHPCSFQPTTPINYHQQRAVSQSILPAAVHTLTHVREAARLSRVQFARAVAAACFVCLLFTTEPLMSFSWLLKIVFQCDPGVGVDAFFHALYTRPSTKLPMLLGSACSEVTESLAKVTPYWNIVQVSEFGCFLFDCFLSRSTLSIQLFNLIFTLLGSIGFCCIRLFRTESYIRGAVEGAICFVWLNVVIRYTYNIYFALFNLTYIKSLMDSGYLILNIYHSIPFS